MLKKLLLLLLLSVFFANSQENTFYHYGINEGLSQESVQTILKSKDGFLWLGTQDGLNRFDGKQFTVYKHDNENKNSISGNFITTLLENQNNIWIGTSNNGVSVYDTDMDIFSSVGDKNGNCTAIEKDKNGQIYVAYLKGRLQVFNHQNDSIIKKDIPFFKNNDLKITSLKIDKNEIYVGTKSGRLFKATINEKLNFNEVSFYRTIGSIKSLFFDLDKLWIGTSDGVFYQKNNILNAVEIKNISSKDNQKLIIYAIKKDKKNYYFATDDGLYICSDFNENTKKFKNIINYKGDKNKTNSITSNRVYDVLIDNDLLWIGTNKLDLLSLEPPVFKGLNTKTNPKIDNNHIYSIFKTNNYLFIGTRNGLNCIDNNGKTTVITKENTNQKLAYNVIRSISKINNYLWLGTTKGVSIIDLTNFNPKNPKIKSFYHDASNDNSLTNNNIRHIFEDNQGQIWISTFGGGLDLFTGNIDKNIFTFKHFRHINNHNSISSDYVFNVSQDKDDVFWIATKNGLNKMLYSKENELFTFTAFYKQNDSLGKIQSNNVLTTFHDSDNNMWIGTSNGLYHLDKKKLFFSIFNEKQGLTNNVIYSILEDRDKNLWLTTNSGIFKFDKNKLNFTNFTPKDGLHSTEFNLGAQFIDTKNNILYFGGTNGVDIFNPNDVSNLYQEGNLKFTSLYIKEKLIKPDANHSIITKNISNTKRIQLKNNDFPLYLTFSDLNFKPYKNSTFYYKLIPNDQNWNPIKKGNEIQLLNLSPGEYQLQLQGKSHQKFWNKQPLEVTLSVLPPWYSSKLAFFAYFIILMSLLFSIARHFLNRKLEHQELERLKEIDHLKTMLYTNITHEFRTPITVILGMAQNIKDKFKDKKLDLKEISLIEKNSYGLLNLVNQILDLSKLEKGKLKLSLEQNDIVKHIKYLTESFASYAQEKNVSLVFYSEEDSILMDYDANKIGQIISNLISNAIKFCDKKEKIIVHLSKNNSNLIIKVKDSGIGIKEENIPFIFDRFYQVENSNTRKYDGSGIGLALVKQLITLMKGSISVKSKVDHGTTFIITLPITQNENISKTNFDVNGITTNTFKDKSIANNQISENTNLPIVLVVEDNKDVAEYIFSCLQGKYQILYAENGLIGVEKAMEFIPDLIISDVMMPKMDGFKMCKLIKEDIKTNHIPVIMLTAKSTQNDKISGLKLGADAYLTKPFHKEELLIRLEKLIALRKILIKKYANIEELVASKKPKEETLNNLNDKFIQSVIEIIHQNIENTEFNADNIAEQLNMSKSQLYRKLKSISNVSISLFIRKIRLLKAKELLETKQYTVSEITYMTGFNSLSWFSKVFKAEFGFSPSNKDI